MTWTWGKLQLPDTDTRETVALELAHWLAELLVKYQQDTVIGPDGIRYDIELSVGLVPSEQTTVIE